MMAFKDRLQRWWDDSPFRVYEKGDHVLHPKDIRFRWKYCQAMVNAVGAWYLWIHLLKPIPYWDVFIMLIATRLVYSKQGNIIGYKGILTFITIIGVYVWILF